MTAVESLFTEDNLRVQNLDLQKRSVGFHILLSKNGENIYIAKMLIIKKINV